MAFLKKWKSGAAFYAQFTSAEKYALQTSSDSALIVARTDLAIWDGEVWSNDPNIIAGLDAMVAAGIITEARKDEILGV